MDKEKNNGKKKLIITMAVALILLVGVTVSYGYIAILGNSKNQELSVGTGDIHLVFDDADTSNVNATLKLGESITKTFKIENKGTKPGKVQINWKNLINTYNSRSLTYTLESSSSKDTGYTKVEALRENVPVSTEAKEVPLSKEITIPVQSTPIYYRVTITFNNLSDVDQSGDVNATLTTQFSLSEPENLSKKVIAVLNGNVKTSDPELNKPAPRYEYGIWTDSYIRSYTDVADDLAANYTYITYSDEYGINDKGKVYLKNPKYGKYQDIYTSLVGKYTSMDYCYLIDEAGIENNVTTCTSGIPYIDKITEASLDSIQYNRLTVDKNYGVEGIFSTGATQSMSSRQNNYIVYADSYKYETFGGRYVLQNPQICKWSECYANLKGKYTVRPTGSTVSKIQASATSAVSINRIDNTDINNMYISTSSRTNDPIIYHDYDGVYKMEDDYGDSYYYRGAITNGYVKFADKYWKILRVNGDGSVRMILSTNDELQWGNRFLNNGESIAFNEKSDDIKYVGYMFGGSSEDAASTSIDDAFENKYSSNAKKVLDTWYETNLTAYSNYISDTLFCGDRKISSTVGNSTYFASHDRLYLNSSPSLICSQKNDRFTVDDETIGNGALTYPIGMITSDEIAISGIQYYNWDTSAITETYYLSNYYWLMTMTPFSYNQSSSSRWFTTPNNISLEVYTNSAARISPVINIKPEYALKMVGSGKIDDPFVVPGA